MPGEEDDIPIDVLPQGWERATTREGIPYYLNHADQQTQWDHPIISELFKELRSLDVIPSSCAAYRAASKLRTLQVITNLYKVNGQMVWRALNELQYENEGGASLFVEEVDALFNKLFSFESKMSRTDIEASIEISLSWALKCYDSGRTGSVMLRPLLVGLILLTASNPINKYKRLFQVYAENNVLSKETFSLLLSDMLMVMESIEEQEIFSSRDIPGAIASLRQMFIDNNAEISEDRFLQWMKKEPRLLVWLPTLHRYVTAESVKHEAKCAVCKAYPIVGYRYRCLKCFNVDLCQSCFWTQQGTRVHKSKHPIREYCMATTSTDDMKDFGSQIRNKLIKRYRWHESKTPFLPPCAVPAETQEEKKAFNKELHERIADLVAQIPRDDEKEQDAPRPVRNDISALQIQDASRPVRNDMSALQIQEPVEDWQRERRKKSEKEKKPTTPKAIPGSPTVSVASSRENTLAITKPLTTSTVAHLPTTTSLTGVSQLTLSLDEWTLGQQGDEEEKLQRMTTMLVEAIPKSPDMPGVMVRFDNSSLLDATKQLEVALISLACEVNRH